MLLRIVLLTTIPLILSYELGAGKQSDAAQYSRQGEKGESGYIGYHENEKGQKGHHNKENHRKEYDEKAGHKNGFDHKDGYYANHHQGEKGRKGYHYEDHGKYAKGHSTKGHHNVHKLKELKKNTDFFDENNDEGFEEKHGGYETSKAIVRGKFHKGGFNKKGSDEEKYGVLGFSDKGLHFFEDKGHKKAQGDDEKYGNFAEFGLKGGQEGFKKFGFISFKKE